MTLLVANAVERGCIYICMYTIWRLLLIEFYLTVFKSLFVFLISYIFIMFWCKTKQKILTKQFSKLRTHVVKCMYFGHKINIRFVGPSLL